MTIDGAFAPDFIPIFEDETPTGIRQTDRVATPNGPMYDLQGRRISAPVRGQIYIQGGEKKFKFSN